MTHGAEAEPLRILVVDDSEDDVLLLTESLRDLPGASIIHVASDGDQALEYLRCQAPHAAAPRPSLVLLDINMPGKSGFEVLCALKRDPALCQIPVIILTTSTRPADVVAAYAQGAASFVVKPSNFDRLRSMAGHLVAYWLGVARVPRAGGFREGQAQP
jgi:CheY-like chemotaxis protein